MLFRLKNTGVTYLRLVRKMFKEEIEKLTKVYVDDMLVKNKRAVSHIFNIGSPRCLEVNQPQRITKTHGYGCCFKSSHF